MMKTRKQIFRCALCAVLTLVLLLGSLLPAAAALTETGKNETPIIFVAGFVSTDTVDQ